MPLDPQTKPVMEALASAPRLSSVPMAEGRRSYDAFRSMGFGPAMDVGRIEDLCIPGPAGTVPARLYRPPASGRRGLVLHIHGGGFVAGSIEGYDQESRAFAALGECSVLAFGYRLAPEERFPAAVEDSVAVLAWSAEHARDLGCDPKRLAVAGDSAGANLAAVAALAARDREIRLALQVLIYPNTDYTDDYPSMEEFAELASLSRSDVEWVRDQYLRSPEDRSDWRASPMLTPTLARAARALVVTAECDVLRDEGEAYARRLKDEGVPAVMRRYQGLPHGFFSMGAFVDAARRAVRETCSSLRDALA